MFYFISSRFSIRFFRFLFRYDTTGDCDLLICIFCVAMHLICLVRLCDCSVDGFALCDVHIAHRASLNCSAPCILRSYSSCVYVASCDWQFHHVSVHSGLVPLLFSRYRSLIFVLIFCSTFILSLIFRVENYLRRWCRRGSAEFCQRSDRYACQSTVFCAFLHLPVLRLSWLATFYSDRDEQQ